jgi:serine protease Do
MRFRTVNVYLVGLILSVNLFFTHSQNVQDNSRVYNLPDLYKKVKPCVYLIYTKNSKGMSQGSAFTVTNGGIAISNYHVFEDASDAIAVNELNEKFLISEILDYNEAQDYIIFRLNTTKKIPCVDISARLPEIGEECFAVGNPEGLTQTLSLGRISSYRENNKLIQTSAEITHGSSGGPLFDKEGKAIGITTSGVGSANLNFAVNLKYIPISQIIYSQNSKSNLINFDIERIKSIISNYYSISDSQNYNKLNFCFNESIKRYFKYYNISLYEAIERAKKYNQTFGVINSSSSVRWNTLKSYKLLNGNLQIEYVLDYRLNRVNKNKASQFVLQIIAEINSSYKITSIYENILAKK